EDTESRGTILFQPLYSTTNQARPQDRGAYYTVRREQRLISTRQRQNGPRTGYVGSEVFLSLVDHAGPSHSTNMRQLQVRCLCSNRDLPLLLRTRGSETDFTLEIGAPVS